MTVQRACSRSGSIYILVTLEDLDETLTYRLDDLGMPVMEDMPLDVAFTFEEKQNLAKSEDEICEVVKKAIEILKNDISRIGERIGVPFYPLETKCITNFEKEIVKRNSEWEAFLDLGNLALKSLPFVIRCFKRTKKISVAGNNLHKLPKTLMQLKELREIDCTGTRIVKIPEFLKHNENLCVTGIESNPENLSILTQRPFTESREPEICEPYSKFSSRG